MSGRFSLLPLAEKLSKISSASCLVSCSEKVFAVALTVPASWMASLSGAAVDEEEVFARLEPVVRARGLSDGELGIKNYIYVNVAAPL